MADEMSPEDFGLGSDFDDALAEATSGDDGSAEGKGEKVIVVLLA